MMDTSLLVQIELEDCGLFQQNSNVLTELKKIFERAVQLSALIFRPTCSDRVSVKATENIISILPTHLGDLTIPIITEHQIRMIENRCPNLISSRMFGRPGALFVETTFVSDGADLESDLNLYL